MRLFKRLESLRTIILSLTGALLPVANAFSVLLLMASLYAVVAVMLFRDLEGHQQHFGQFSLALFTMIQISSGDGWATEIVRPMHNGDAVHDQLISLFFTSYFVLTGIVMLNVVVAVLLDGTIRSSSSPANNSTSSSSNSSGRPSQRHADETCHAQSS